MSGPPTRGLPHARAPGSGRRRRALAPASRVHPILRTPDPTNLSRHHKTPFTGGHPLQVDIGPRDLRLPRQSIRRCDNAPIVAHGDKFPLPVRYRTQRLIRDPAAPEPNHPIPRQPRPAFRIHRHQQALARGHSQQVRRFHLPMILRDTSEAPQPKPRQRGRNPRHPSGSLHGSKLLPTPWNHNPPRTYAGGVGESGNWQLRTPPWNSLWPPRSNPGSLFPIHDA